MVELGMSRDVHDLMGHRAAMELTCIVRSSSEQEDGSMVKATQGTLNEDCNSLLSSSPSP